MKAGLIGAAIGVVLTLLAQIPIIGWVCCLVLLLVYAGAGITAGNFVSPPRSGGAGAIAGLITGAVAGLMQAVVTLVQVALGFTTGGFAFDPQQLQELAELGVDIDPEMLDILPAAGVAGG